MNGFRFFTVVALSGAMALLTGCTGRKEVALANKDEAIRNQKELLVQAQANQDSLMQTNNALADQNKQLAEKNAAIAMKQSEQTAQMQADLADLKKMLASKPGGGTDESMVVHGQKDGAIHITVAGSVVFEPGHADLKASAHAMLKKVASTIKAKYPNNYVRIEGHTDSTPVVHSKDKYSDNMALSLARARAVYDYLASEGGLSPSKLYAAGYGDKQPLVHPEKTAADRNKNRRVEIVIMPSDVKVQKDQLASTGPAAASSTAKRK